MTDSVFSYLDAYCERAGDPGLFAEPFNLVTNIFFIAGGVYTARAIAKLPPGTKRYDLWGLFALMVAIGIGSGLWHLSPTRATLLMDVIPIGLFIHLYLISALRRLFALDWWKVGALWLIYVVADGLIRQFLPPDFLNGTVMYLPTYATLLAMSLALYFRKPPVGRVFLMVVAVWTLSLTFRTIDMDICPRIAIGSHFLWHVLNAWVLWRLTMALLASARGR